MVINNIRDLAAHRGTTVARLEEEIRRNTKCGAWIIVSDSLVELGCDVEGSEEWFSEQFVFPFSSEYFDQYLEDLEETWDYYRREANKRKEKSS